MKIDGACACGAIKIEGEADPEKAQICHCTDCQTGTGTAFRVSIPVPGNTLKMTGTPTLFVKTTADSGRPRVQAFCGKCGSPIYSTTPGDGVQPSYTVRVGILRQRDQLIPRRQNWYRSARSWVTGLAGIPKNEKQAPA
ncbi:MAG TPA: GFA family protein [Xanthobacteraceae bacterium]|nr:GFA family protein [Xanthobacteraceae bacterium]